MKFVSMLELDAVILYKAYQNVKICPTSKCSLSSGVVHGMIKGVSIFNLNPQSGRPGLPPLCV